MKTSNPTIALLFLGSLGAIASAAPITLIDPSTALSAAVDYRIFVNPGGNQVTGSNPTSAGFFISGDPANLSHIAFDTDLNDGELLSTASLDLNLQTSGPTGSRIASYFVGVPVSATYDPAFAVNRAPQYTIVVSSSLGSNSYIGTGSASGLDILSLLNFGSLLDVANTSRNITVTWHDSVDFLTPPNMVKNSSSLPGNNSPREYQWSVTAGLTGASQLNLDLSVPEPPTSVPEPSSLVLLGSSLVALTRLSPWLARRKQR